MYLYEMHCHTNIASKCAQISPKEIVHAYHSQGFAGIVITDHFFNGNCTVGCSLPWDEMVEKYCSAYEQAKEEGDKIGLKVFFGFEYSSNNNPLGREGYQDRNPSSGTDFLIYGLDKEWLLSKDKSILELSVNEFMKMVRQDGGFVVQAHPFRLAKSYMDHISLFPNFTDCVEVLNTSPNTMGRANKLAKKYAKEYHFYRIAGSDAHGMDREYFGVLKTFKKAETIHDIIRQIKERSTIIGMKKNKLCNKKRGK